MNKSVTKNYEFENSTLRCLSYISEFTIDIYNEFDLVANQRDLGNKINDLMNGKIVNHTEKQSALHPKYRKDGPKLNDHLVKLINRIKNNHEIKNVNIVVIGIGGSIEGPKLLIESINSPQINNQYSYHFITGSDIYEFEYKTSNLNPDETVFIISSKSFSTEETIQMMKLALAWSSRIENFIAITSNPTKAKEFGFNESSIISFDKEIYGRYSIWSPIAEIPLSNDSSYESFLKGGRQVDIDLLENQKFFELLKRLSFSDVWNNNFKNKHIRSVLTFIWSLRSLPNYIQQLEMESLGKSPGKSSKFKKTGQIIFGGYGPRAQHSYFQLFHQGTQELCADIIASNNSANSLAYLQAITQAEILAKGVKDTDEREKVNGNVSVNLFSLKKTDPFSLGYLIAMWEYRVFITAVLLDVNPFDQFGVGIGKAYTKKILGNLN